MKTKEEIEQLAQEIHYSSAMKGLDDNGCFNQYQGFIQGYIQCQEDMSDKKYTEEDIRKAFYYGGKSVIDEYGTFEEYINSLNKKD